MRSHYITYSIILMGLSLIGIFFVIDIPIYLLVTLIISLGVIVLFIQIPNLEESLSDGINSLNNFAKEIRELIKVNFKNNKEYGIGKNQAKAILRNKKGEIIAEYYSTSGMRTPDYIINYLSKENSYSVTPLPENSPFRITERLSPDLDWIKIQNLEAMNEKDKFIHEVVFNQFNNCTERKIIHDIYSEYKDKIKELSELNLLIHTQFEPCLYCYKLLKDIKDNENTNIKFNSLKVTYNAIITEVKNPEVKINVD